MAFDLENVSLLVSCYNKSGDFIKFQSNALDFIQAKAEICIIDDGSTDESRILLEGFAKSNKKIIFSSRPNHGSGTTRNDLINLASRKYLVFLDMDDEIEIQGVVDSIKFLEKENADIAVSNYFNTTSNSKGNMPLYVNEACAVEIEDISEGIWECLGFWRYVYRKDYLTRESISFFPTNLETRGRYFIFDDMFFLSQLAASKGRAVVMPSTEIIYRYYAPVFDKLAQNKFRTQLEVVPMFALEFLKQKNREFTPNKSLVFVTRYVHFAASNLYINKSLQTLPVLLNYAFREGSTGHNYLAKLNWVMQALINSYRSTKRAIRKVTHKISFSIF
jgi:glycosyltransferase involved in cell wall biosynthesis